ncbi:DUF2971 domain-containing protein [Thiobaca trueperi]|uniref:DUF2971 family protein n=1 Tax=Thiobaca trueperi TaxID=127458 RepID=A0A4R3MUZ4_9GAMM|nr:DUF2971 domain-containing protein [Thiobaca trueperi]TCT20318.1 DUF2971 family protein [Thiobaca trueperi]
MHQLKPGKRAFYKYTSPETALAILQTGKVRYSSPLTFNDPFDIQSGLHFDFDLEALHKKIIDRIGELAAAPDEPRVDSDDSWGKLVLEARKNYPIHGFPRDRWVTITKAPFDFLLSMIKDTRRQYEQHWKNRLLPGSRVFCVSEDRDNLLMWAHYGSNHTGAVFEFWSLPSEDNPLSVASPIQYKETPPSFFSEEEWINDLTGLNKLDHNALYKRYAYIKSTEWSYEREWRVWYPLVDERQLYDNVAIRKSEFTSIYIGCCSKPEFERNIPLSFEFFADRHFVTHQPDL